MPRLLAPSFLAMAASIAQPASAAGDLLVAPTRIVLEGGRGTEVILNNVGAETATYRISLELVRMTADGGLADVVPGTESDKEKATLGLISYAPRRVTLAPNQPQVVRVGVRMPEGLPDGEYRAHMLFRGLPDAVPATTVQPRSGVSIALIPIYGVRIPVIVRKGALNATAAISDVRLGGDGTGVGKALLFNLSRTGDRSVYGKVRVTRPGVAKPIFEKRGLAVYAEVSKRSVALPLSASEAAALSGPITVQYLEDNDAGGLIAEARTVIR